ncbi:MAG: RNA polymerase sigma factor [Prolixibacteraceae bacterium]
MRLKAGAQSWFKDVFDEYYEYIRNYLFYLSGDVKLSEDLTQDVFLQLWENRKKVKEETLRSYLFTIARNSYFKDFRKQKSDLKFKSGYFEKVENESPEFLMELKEFDNKLQKTISDMPEKCRTIYLMNRIDDMTYAEIADSLNVGVKAIEKQMSKALAILRKELGVKI